jgi:hypothetical protein
MYSPVPTQHVFAFIHMCSPVPTQHVFAFIHMYSPVPTQHVFAFIHMYSHVPTQHVFAFIHMYSHVPTQHVSACVHMYSHVFKCIRMDTCVFACMYTISSCRIHSNPCTVRLLASYIYCSTARTRVIMCWVFTMCCVVMYARRKYARYAIWKHALQSEYVFYYCIIIQRAIQFRASKVSTCQG